MQGRRLQGQSTMGLFTVLDLIALAGFVIAWGGYSILVEWTPHGRLSLNSRMNGYREMWMRRMLARDNRMVDMQIMAALQNGTAFFASTSLIAIGGALTLLRSSDDMMALVSTLPLGVAPAVGGQDGRPRRGPDLCVLQVRLVVPPL
jgi:uncharacterized membrane protein